MEIRSIQESEIFDLVINARALYMFLLMPAMVDSVVTSAELMILLIKYWIKNECLRAVGGNVI